LKYGAILADPPWAFKTYGGKHTTPHRGAQDHYSVMPFEEIAKLPVSDMAAKDCALFMWVVDSHLDEAFKLGAAWGFNFKTRTFTWRKLTSGGAAKIGMGYWTRKQTEMCWLFTKGKPARLSKGVREIIDAQRREHSRKPDEQYERIEALVGGPYLEMFARTRRPGWDVWGNQTEKFAMDDMLA
jgi:N6-adenosine-specific RNA methylase IME4